MEHAQERLREKRLNQFSHQVNWQKKTMLFDETGNSSMTVDALIKQYALSRDGVIEPENLYDLTPIGLLKLKSISYKKVEANFQLKDIVKVNDVSKAILEDVLANRALYLNDDLSITDVAT